MPTIGSREIVQNMYVKRRSYSLLLTKLKTKSLCSTQYRVRLATVLMAKQKSVFSFIDFYQLLFMLGEKNL